MRRDVSGPEQALENSVTIEQIVSTERFHVISSIWQHYAAADHYHYHYHHYAQNISDLVNYCESTTSQCKLPVLAFVRYRPKKFKKWIR